MIMYNGTFNGNFIYDYPFNDFVNSFLLLGWKDINIFSEQEFNNLFLFFRKNCKRVYIKKLITGAINVALNQYDIKDFTYKVYRELYLGKGNYNMYVDSINIGISFSEEFFCLIGGPRDHIRTIIKIIGEIRLEDGLCKFEDEWINGNINWATKLLSHQKRISTIKWNNNNTVS